MSDPVSDLQEENKLSDLLIKNVLPPFEKELVLQSILVYQIDGEEKKCILINRTLEKQKKAEKILKKETELNNNDCSSVKENTDEEGLSNKMPTLAEQDMCNSRRKRKINRPTRIPQMNEIDQIQQLQSIVKEEEDSEMDVDGQIKPLSDSRDNCKDVIVLDEKNNRIIIENNQADDTLTLPMETLSSSPIQTDESQQKLFSEILNIDQLLALQSGNNNSQLSGNSITSNNHGNLTNISNAVDKGSLTNILYPNTLNLLESVNKQSLAPLLATSILQTTNISQITMDSMKQSSSLNNNNNCSPLDLSNNIQSNNNEKALNTIHLTASTHNVTPLTFLQTTSTPTTANGMPRPIRPRLSHFTMIQAPGKNGNIMHLQQQQVSNASTNQNNSTSSSLIGSLFNNISVFPTSNANGAFGHQLPTTTAINISSLQGKNINFTHHSNNNNNSKPVATTNGCLQAIKKPILSTNQFPNKLPLPINVTKVLNNNANVINANNSNKLLQGTPRGDEKLDDSMCQSRRYAKSFVCNQCKSIFTSLSALCEHTFAVHKSFRCTICDAQFTQRSNLQRHSLRHVGFKPFICNICSKAYYRKDHLVRHIELSHPGANPRVSITVKLSSAECLDFLERNPPADSALNIQMGHEDTLKAQMEIMKVDEFPSDEELMDDSQLDDDTEDQGEVKTKLMKIDEDEDHEVIHKEKTTFKDFKTVEPVKLDSTC